MPPRYRRTSVLLFFAIACFTWLCTPNDRQTIRDVQIRIPLNGADASSLLLLPGIGEEKAFWISNHKGCEDRWHRMEELAEIPGIGPRLVEKVQKYIVVD